MKKVPTVKNLTIKVDEHFDFTSTEYRRLYKNSGASAFQAPIFMDLIHRKLVPNLRSSQFTLVVRENKNNELFAVFPLIIQETGITTIIQPADFGVCDYNSIVAHDENLDIIAGDTYLLKLINDLVTEGDIFLFRKSRADKFDIAKIFSRTSKTLNENAAYHTEFGPDVQTWKKRISQSMVAKLGQLQRKLEREHGPYIHEKCSTEEDIRDAFEFLKRARQGKFDDDLLNSDLYFQFYEDYAVRGSLSGEACTYVSRVDEEIVAILFGVCGDDIFHGVLIESDREKYEKYSIGKQLYYNVMLDQFESGRKELDLSIGNSGYKHDFGVTETLLMNYTSASSLRGSAAAAIYNHAKPVKRFLQRYVPHVR